jgi:hypothetical protein
MNNETLDRITSGSPDETATPAEREAMERLLDIHGLITVSNRIFKDEEEELHEIWPLISDKPYPSSDVELLNALEPD